MGTQHHDKSEDKCKESKGLKTYRRVADRVQEWNRAIPEAGYVTLGTIRYGVRLSTRAPPISLSTTSKSSKSLERSISEGGIGENSSYCGCSTSQCSRQSDSFSSCCCVGQPGLHLPWTNNYPRTRLPLSAAAAKNRPTTSQVSPTTSATSHQPALTQLNAPNPLNISGYTSNTGSKSTNICGQISSNSMDHHTQMNMSKTHVPKLQPSSPTISVGWSMPTSKHISSTAPSTCTSKSLIHLEGSCSSTETILTPRHSVSESFSGTCATSCCEPNSASVSIGPRREISLTPPKSTSNICCYTITNNSSRNILKQPNLQSPNFYIENLESPNALISNTLNSRNNSTGPVYDNRNCNSAKAKITKKEIIESTAISDNFAVRDQSNQQFRNSDRDIQHCRFYSDSYVSSEIHQGAGNSYSNRYAVDDGARCEFLNCFSGSPGFRFSEKQPTRAGSLRNNRQNVSLGAKDICDCNAALNATSDENHFLVQQENQVDNNGTKSFPNFKGSSESECVDCSCDILGCNSSICKYDRSNDRNLKQALTKDITPKQSTEYIPLENVPKVSQKFAKSTSEQNLNAKRIHTENNNITDESNEQFDNDSDIGYIDASADADSLSVISGEQDLYTSDTLFGTEKCEQSLDAERVSIDVRYCFIDTNLGSDAYGHKKPRILKTISEHNANKVAFSHSDCDLHHKIAKVKNGNQDVKNCAAPQTSLSHAVIQPTPLHQLAPLSTGISKYSRDIDRQTATTDLAPFSPIQKQFSKDAFAKELIMERRRINLDRWQRLGFGRKSSSSSNQQSSKASNKKGSDKSERLKELTEKLKGNRSSPTPPPVPPPRKPRQSSAAGKQSSIELALTPKSVSDDIILMDADDERLLEPISRNSDDVSHFADQHEVSSLAGTPEAHKRFLYEELKPHTSISNLEQIIMDRDKRSCPPVSNVKDDEIFSKLPRAESRTIVGSYMQKSIPFRSASFSQIDYSSGKYIKSALSAIRDKLRGDKQASVVDNANLTLPRKKSSFRSSSPSFHGPGNDIQSNTPPRQLKKSELTINLKYEENDRPSLEEIVNPPAVIFEEESPLPDSDQKDGLEAGPLNCNIDRFPLSNTEQSCGEFAEEPAVTIDSTLLTNVGQDEESQPCVVEIIVDDNPYEEKLIPDCVKSNVATIGEEDVSLELPPENFLQTATTCLIPVPVYECGGDQWQGELPWLDMAQDEIGLSPEIIEATSASFPSAFIGPQLPELNTNEIIAEIPVETDPTTLVTDVPDSTDEKRQKSTIESKEKNLDLDAENLEENISVDNQKPTEFVEVKKRNSNNEARNCDPMDCPSPGSPCSEEKRRIDKSRRRKGMYIQWPAIEKHGEINPEDWACEQDCLSSEEFPKADSHSDLTQIDFASAKLDKPGFPVSSSSAKVANDVLIAVSQNVFDPTTPDSDNSRPTWPKSSRRTSLTCQSSEEKDDTSCTASPALRSHRNLIYLRSDSTSDNESDKSLINRDRTSPSPVPVDPDLRRYSKRPLRGPYGQMLEAEMKKPGKVQYDEILEELKSAESLNTLPIPAITNLPGKYSFDESCEPDTSKTQFANEQNDSLLIPVHTRAASTPSQMENMTTTASLGSINPQHKRYQSNLDHTALESLRQKDPKKFSLDSHHDSSSKRSSGEYEKKNPARRSASTASDKHQKRSLDETRLTQSSRTPSERCIANPCNYPENQNLIPSPELLAELLKGSSERLVSEQRQQVMAAVYSGSSPLHQHVTKSSSYTQQPAKLVGQQSLNHSKSERFRKVPSSTCSDSEEDLDRRAQIELINKINLSYDDDTRTHVVQEIYRNEQSYVDSLHIVVNKYMNVLKSPEYAGMIDPRAVNEIFFMVPEILSIHEKFLNELKIRLDSWDLQQKVGDAFIETFSQTEVLETYTAFVNNCNKAKNTIKMLTQTRPSFARFLEAMSREHKGKLPLDNLLIKPVQKFPNYEMLFTRLIKHTDVDHPDQKPLQEVLKLVHDILVHINCKEKELLENIQREATLRDLESVIEGISDLVTPDRQFLLFDLVSMPSGQGARKERGFFLFSDLLVITSIKRRSGTIRKPNTATCPGSVAATLDTNKYKFLTKISLDNLDIVKSKYVYKRSLSISRRKYRILDSASQVQPKLPASYMAKDENVRKIMNEIEQLAEDCNKLQQIAEIAASLRYPHAALEENIRDLQREVQRQLFERQSNDTQLSMLELTVNSPSGMQNLSIVFCKPEKRSHWEETFNEAKQKLVASLERYPVPEFLSSIPIRKTRAGLQFTCAAPTISSQKDVWVCNSDGYVGQVCVLSLTPEPTVTSCNGVCNARILCVASVPAVDEGTSYTSSNQISDKASRSSRNSNSSSCQSHRNSGERKKGENRTDNGGNDIQLDSNSSSDDSEGEGSSLDRIPSPSVSTAIKHSQQEPNLEDSDCHQSTMWLGTEDGCIHVYNCNDNIRIKKNKIKIQHVSAVYSILYLDNRVFVSLANGDICVYLRDNGGWNTSSPHCLSIGTVTGPVNRLLNVHGKLWCSIQGIIKVLDTKSFQVENQIQISSDAKPVTNMTVSNNNVWVSIQNSAHIKCFHSNSYELIFEVNLAPSVNKMLSNCDDIIRQHKAACLRVTSLLACKDLVWVGTSAGVLLTIPAQGCSSKGQGNNIPVVTGIPHGHTGHVRFLTYVETNNNVCEAQASGDSGNSSSSNTAKANRASGNVSTKSESGTVLLISGGDGYEDFRSSGVNTMSEVAGREDSTNHLLLWQM